MKTELKPYPAYHAARVSWADSIPMTWETGWLGECSRTIQTGPFGSQLHAEEYQTDGVPVINPSNITASKVVPDWEITVTEKKANELRRHRFQIGDLVFARRGEMGRCAAISETEAGWLCGTGSMLVRLKEQRLLPTFAVLMLSQAGIRDTLSLQSVGATMDNLNTHILAKLRFPLPPLDEQRSILAFLDRETTKIDRLMEVRRNQVERLQEQRTAVIHHAVTRGLDPNAKMKPSELPWAEYHPSHWQRIRLKFIGGITLGKMITNKNEGDMALRPYLKARNVRWETVDVSDLDEMWFTPAEMKSLRLRRDDLVVSEGGEVGRTAIWRDEAEECYLQNSVHKVTIRPEHDPEYILYQFYTAGHAGHFDAIVNRISIAHLTREKLADVSFIVPTIAEQQEIVAHIKRETAKLDTLAAKYRRELELLAEYRASLISHAVTGKIDVRGIVPTVAAD